MAIKSKGEATARTEQRLEWVIERLERTPRDSAVVRAVCRKFDVSPRQAREYVRAAYERIRAERKEAAPFDFERMLNAKLDVYEKALADRERALAELERDGMEPGDRAKMLAVSARCLQVANAASDQATKMTGGYAPVRVEHSGGIDVSAMTPAQQDARLRELEAKRAAAIASAGKPARAKVEDE